MPRSKLTLKERAKSFKEFTPGKDHEVLRPNAIVLALSILSYRKTKRLTQKRLAQALRIPQSQIAYLETGWANPKLSTLLKLAQAMDTTVDGLFRKTDT